MKKSVLLLAALLATSVSGCGGGGDGGGDTSVEDAFGDTPTCSEVWKVGAALDLDAYEGCQAGDTLVAAVTSGCYDAENNYVGQYATFEDRLWVVQVGTDQQTAKGGAPGEVTDVNPNC